MTATDPFITGGIPLDDTTEVKPDQTVALNGPGETPPVPPALAEKRLFKYQTSGLFPGQTSEQLYQQIANGGDDYLRQSGAAYADQQKTLGSQKRLLAAMEAKGGPLTPDEVKLVETTQSDPTGQWNINIGKKKWPTDPRSAVEEHYAINLMNQIDETASKNPDSWWREAVNGIPIAVTRSKREASTFVTKMEYARKHLEDIETSLENQSWFDWGVYQVARNTPFLGNMYHQGMLRGNVDTEGLPSPFLSESVYNQSRALLALPFDEYKDKFDAIVKYLKSEDPALAHEFVKAVVGNSSKEEVINDIPDLIGIPIGAVGIARAGIRITQGAMMANKVRGVYKNIIKGAANDPATRAAMKDVTGDVDAAATSKAAEDIAANIAGKDDPLKEAQESLPSVWQTMKRNIAGSPGSMSGELVNRLFEYGDRFYSEVLFTAQTIQKVERVPGFIAMERAVDEYKDKVLRGRYPGLRNQIYDITDPIWDPLTNNHFFHIDYMAPGGKLWFNQEQAFNAAENYKFKGAKVVRSDLSNPDLSTKDVTRTTFKTAKGSEYQVMQDGTTVRNKAARPEHVDPDDPTKLDQGQKPRSHKTVYVTEQDANRLAPPNRFRYVDHGDGKMSLEIPAPKQGWKAAPMGERVAYQTAPKEGLVPVELWAKDPDKGYNNAHFGNKITEVTNVTTKEVRVVPKGLGYLIRVKVPLDETHPIVRNALLELDDAVTPDSLHQIISGWLGSARTAEETLSKEQRMARLTAAYAPQALLRVLKENHKFIQDVASGAIRIDPVTGQPYSRWATRTNVGNVKTNHKQWTQAVEAANDAIDPVTLEKGYWFKSPGELEEFYQLLFKRAPSFEENAAYFAFVQNQEADLFLRRTLKFSLKSRVGGESFAIYSLAADGTRAYSNRFDGVKRTDGLPMSTQNMLVVGSRQGEEKIVNLGKAMNPKYRAKLEKDVKTGEAALMEIIAPEEKPLQGWGKLVQDSRVKYILVPKGQHDVKPLAFNEQVPRRGGYHNIYDYDHYIKQADVEFDPHSGFYYYNGDTTLMPTGNRAMGGQIAKHINEMREHIGKGDIPAAKAKLIASKLDIPWEEVESWFIGRRNADGSVTPKRLNLHEPLRVVPRDKIIKDLDKEMQNRYFRNGEDLFRDASRQGSISKQFQVQFTGERDANGVMTINDIGSAHNPIYKWERPEMVDPIATMNRGLAKITNSRFMDDYKIASVEHFLQETKMWLQPSDADLKAAPMWHFHHPEWKKDTPDEIKSKFMSNWYKIRDFIGTPSSVDTAVFSLQQRLQDSIYENFGPAVGAKKPLILLPTWALATATDAPRLIRSFTFHLGLGLFSVPQIVVQSMTYANIYGIAGAKYANAGTMGALFHQWSRINQSPEFIKALDEYASKLKIPGMSHYKPGEFAEAMRELEKTGFGHVGGEYALLNDPLSTKMVTNAWGDFLDLGAGIFKGTERNSRYGAWYTAFREFRDENPTGRITNTERKAILSRADLLNNNMSRASASMMNHGVLSIPTQFYTYILRQAELMTGKRLTTLEKGRLLATNSALFGLPVGLSTYGFPVGDFIKKNQIETGSYIPGEHFLTTLINEGIPATLLYYATGNMYNIGERYGSNGYELLREILRDDKSAWELLGGAAFNKFSNAWGASDGFRRSMISLLKGDGKWALTNEDLVQPFKEASSVNYLNRGLVALNTGKWVSKKGLDLASGISPTNAMFMTIMGLQPLEASTMQTLKWSRDDEVELQKWGLSKFIENMRKGFNNSDNPEQARALFKNAFAYLEVSGYPDEKKRAAISLASKGYETLTDAFNWDYYMRNVPPAEKAIRMDAYRRMQQMKAKNK